MKPQTRSSLLNARQSSWPVTLLPLLLLTAVNGQPVTSIPAMLEPETTTLWQSAAAIHLCGLPAIKAQQKGMLRIAPHEITFTTSKGRAQIQYQNITAVTSRNERVELWGIKGRLLRMAIPNGGGLAAAAVMHHRIDMLTLEFRTSDGAYHAAVFVVPAPEIETARRQIAAGAEPEPALHPALCTAPQVRHNTVLLLRPSYGQLQVPAAYRALVYERLAERLSQAKGISHVYRDGEADPQRGCAQYSLEMAATTFKPGSQVTRAATGPVGFFVGTTQMAFRLNVTDRASRQQYVAEIKAAQRTESENTKVADALAKKAVKQFSKDREGAHAQ